MLKYVYLEQIDSTNAYLQCQQSEFDIRNWVVSADEQTAGNGKVRLERTSLSLWPWIWAFCPLKDNFYSPKLYP